ncbi:MAG: DUF4157 domain-containing protein [Bacteroidia bacterium]|nr:DUF4157 domain-containing protein [Bacteroidia bacterium]
MQTTRIHKEQQSPGLRHADRRKRVEEDGAVLSAEKAPHIAFSPPPIQRKENRTGLPDDLKAGLEQLSGFAMDDVQVHYNSAHPAQLQAYAYAQGGQIHLGPGQERHLPHEAWHVVQQKQGRVKATTQFKSGLPLNDDSGLEQEADVMGMKAMQLRTKTPQPDSRALKQPWANTLVVQRQEITEEAAEAAMEERAEAFHQMPHQVLTPWGDDPQDTNCHGYTIHGGIGHELSGEELLEALDEDGDPPPVLVFVRNGQIAHSGILNGDGFTHFLIGVGIVRSQIGDSTAGYEHRYLLPADREALDEYLQPALDAEAAAGHILHMVQSMDRALNLGLPGAGDLSIRVFALQDDEDHPERDEIIAAFDAFAAQHPEILVAEEYPDNW